MKIFHTICAAFMAATIASCDAHQDFPDTSMKIGDILCTDGKVVRYEEMKAQEKTPIAVVFYVNQKEDIEGTGYAVYLKDIERWEQQYPCHVFYLYFACSRSCF